MIDKCNHCLKEFECGLGKVDCYINNHKICEKCMLDLECNRSGCKKKVTKRLDTMHGSNGGDFGVNGIILRLLKSIR